ncbi:oxygenase MpaB family protein [uncultured Leifsonia sp.]|uniref:oxygenase MpaB family protein n=1 Tax=uncultured Leifsonia sp. TaxID=340359 RepID=UPI0025DF277E|nr:oxygenase MpaB family protein [uncultured Leifsonia sp.]
MAIQPDRHADLRSIAGEALSLAGAGRALLLQIAHPAVGRGVAEHSDFAARIVDRFHATMTFVYAAVFAPPEAFDAVRRQVDRAHRPVHAVRSGDLPAYNAFDPQLQLWVSATLYATMVDLNERVYGPLATESREQVYDDFRHLGLNLQLRPEAWPADTAAFGRYWDGMLPQLAVNESTRALAEQILRPRGVPVWLRGALPASRLVTTGLLPASVRTQFGLPWDDRIEQRFDLRMRWAAAAYPHLPAAIRHRPRDVYLRRLQEAGLQTAGLQPRISK